MDITPTLAANSGQLNADDLIGGPVTVRIKTVSRGSADQPVVVRLEGPHMPWMPCKTSLRLLAYIWGTDGSAWHGRRLVLYRDPKVKWAGKAVGGIRVSHASDITKRVTLQLTSTRGKKEPHSVDPLPDNAPQTTAPTANMDGLLRDAELTRDDVNRWLLSKGKPTLEGASKEKEAELAAWLAGDPSRLDDVRAVGKVLYPPKPKEEELLKPDRGPDLWRIGIMAYCSEHKIDDDIRHRLILEGTNGDTSSATQIKSEESYQRVRSLLRDHVAEQEAAERGMDDEQPPIIEEPGR